MDGKINYKIEGIMKKLILMNIIFILIFVSFLILSIFFWFFLFIPIFFLPLCCYLPFAFKNKAQRQEQAFDPNLQYSEIRKCPVCEGEIKESVAQYCYHCGSELNKN